MVGRKLSNCLSLRRGGRGFDCLAGATLEEFVATLALPEHEERLSFDHIVKEIHGAGAQFTGGHAQFPEKKNGNCYGEGKMTSREDSDATKWVKQKSSCSAQR